VQEDGISIDFGDLKIIQQQIDSLLDHGTLVWEKDTPLLSWLVQNGQRHMRFSNPPTAEVIAQYLVDLCRKHSLPIHAVRVWETAKCSVEEICG
jgi:6-pyruvoyl-tetrahydropterin synthase